MAGAAALPPPLQTASLRTRISSRKTLMPHHSRDCPPNSTHNTPGLYIHIPFCRQKCGYCDFYSTNDMDAIPAFSRSLYTEMAMRRADIPGPFGSVYLGGGTPSALPGAAIAGILQEARTHFPVLDDAEITVEANPESITPSWLRSVICAGANRINIGVQSFDNAMLKLLGRIHSASQAIYAVHAARHAGIENVGIDLIYGIPGQTSGHVKNDLETALNLAPSHMACYMLTYEPNTPLTVARDAGSIKALSDARTGRFFSQVATTLTQGGYHQYEISNFAQTPRHTAIHNAKYWQRIPYLGLGPAAHSFTGAQRTWNVRRLDQYCDMLSKGRPPVAEREDLSRDQQMLEAIYLGLRTVEGIDIPAFNREFAVNFEAGFAPVLDDCMARHLLAVSEGRCAPTAKGMRFHETIVRELYDSLTE